MLALIAQTEAVPNQGGADADSYLALLWFAGLVIGALVVIQVIRSLQGKAFSVTFARLTGLIFIATIGAVLALAEVANEARTAAFTLLGTIAGYLAGARPTNTEISSPPPRRQRGGQPGRPGGGGGGRGGGGGGPGGGDTPAADDDEAADEAEPENDLDRGNRGRGRLGRRQAQGDVETETVL